MRKESDVINNWNSAHIDTLAKKLTAFEESFDEWLKELEDQKWFKSYVEKVIDLNKEWFYSEIVNLRTELLDWLTQEISKLIKISGISTSSDEFVAFLWKIGLLTQKLENQIETLDT